MFSATERARTHMDSTRDNRYRIAAAAQVDRFFESYEIDMAPEEALSFVATAPGDSDAVYVLIDAINRAVPPANFGPNHPRTGTAHHAFQVGRRHGDRVVVLEIFKGYLALDFAFDDLVETIRQHAQIAGSSLDQESDENSHRFTFMWNSKENQ